MGLKNFKQNSSPACSTCGLRNICLPRKLALDELKAFEFIIPHSKKVLKGDKLFRKADLFKNLYCIRIGSFKSSVTSRDGTEQVTGFYMPGEVLGLCGVSGNGHFCDVTALEDAEVCVVPYSKLEDFCNKNSQLNKNFLRFLSAEVVRGHKNLLSLGSLRADEKLASFLIDLSQRYEARGYSRTEFVLRMTRGEIGSFLGLKLETVSRVLSKFADSNLIEIHQKRVHILNLAGLKSILIEECRTE